MLMTYRPWCKICVRSGINVLTNLIVITVKGSRELQEYLERKLDYKEQVR